VNSGTSGLHLAVKAAGIKPGDEVVTSPFSFIASANCILFERATPVFVDIDPVTYNIDPGRIEAAITRRTKAILPVHVFGRPCAMEAILEIAQRFNLTVIEDACEAVGARAKGVKVGQKRLVHPWIGCGKCAVCKAGQDNYCVSGSRILGVNRAGAYSTHVLVPDPKYLIDASGVDESFAATLACSGLTAYSAAAKLPPLTRSDRVAVIGCGGVGLAGVSVLRAKGVKHIVACDIDDGKLASAARLGATESVNTRSADAAQKLAGIAGAIDFVGTPGTAALGIAALRKGGRYVLVGLHGGELVHPLPPIAQRAIGIVGSYVGNLQELKEVVALAKKKKLKPLPIETRPAERANSALEDLNAGRVAGRVVLDFETLISAEGR
jgi:D-arabinose 1-dehydrogenase-like Zn-dependent alcohol dehydrogenase